MDKETRFILDAYAAIIQLIILLVFTILMVKEYLSNKKIKKSLLEHNLKIEKLTKENN